MLNLGGAGGRGGGIEQRASIISEAVVKQRLGAIFHGLSLLFISSVRMWEMHFDKNFGVDTSLVSSSVQFGILKDIIKLIIIIKNPSRNDETKISGIETHTHEKAPIGGERVNPFCHYTAFTCLQPVEHSSGNLLHGRTQGRPSLSRSGYSPTAACWFSL